MAKQFKARLTARGPKGAWTFIDIPFDVERAFGTRARVAVTGTINGFPFRNSLMPQGDGSHAMAVAKNLQVGAKARVGDFVQVELDIDRNPRDVVLPEELAAVLEEHPNAKRAFESLSASHRRAYADWVGGAKRPETRASRAAKSASMVVERRPVR